MARFQDIRAGLITAYQAALTLPTGYQNAVFKRPDGLHAKLWVMPSQPSVGTMGAGGIDGHGGIMQINLYDRLGNGEKSILAAADQIADRFPAGRWLHHGSASVLILACGISAGEQADDYYYKPITIDYSAYARRTNV